VHVYAEKSKRVSTLKGLYAPLLNSERPHTLRRQCPNQLPAPPIFDAYAALRVPDYRRFLSMRLCTTLAIQIMSVSVGYYVYDLTGDPLMLGLVGLTEAIPAIGISLWAGHIGRQAQPAQHPGRLPEFADPMLCLCRHRW
jgi:hypothetical protein